MKGAVCLIATMDTKAKEARFLRDEILKSGLEVILIDVGIRKESPKDADITQRTVLGENADKIKSAKTRAEAAGYMDIRGAERGL